MPNDGKLPVGIRNNNPGNLRSGEGHFDKVAMNEGFAVFDSMKDGVGALASLVWNYYNAHGLRTLPDFIGRYAPASKNDTHLYVRFVGLRMAINPLRWATHDLKLNDPWNAIDLMRAIIAEENGAPPLKWSTNGEWISPGIFIDAMRASRKWQHV